MKVHVGFSSSICWTKLCRQLLTAYLMPSLQGLGNALASASLHRRRQEGHTCAEGESESEINFINPRREIVFVTAAPKRQVRQKMAREEKTCEHYTNSNIKRKILEHYTLITLYRRRDRNTIRDTENQHVPHKEVSYKESAFSWKRFFLNGSFPFGGAHLLGAGFDSIWQHPSLVLLLRMGVYLPFKCHIHEMYRIGNTPTFIDCLVG